MKQGRADRDVAEGYKPDPIGNVVSVKAVEQIGSTLGNHVTNVGVSIPRGSVSDTLYKGKVGFLPPPDVEWDINPSGSQGRR